jgi:hypothetical protein
MYGNCGEYRTPIAIELDDLSDFKRKGLGNICGEYRTPIAIGGTDDLSDFKRKGLGNICGEYRSRTGDLLHAMQAL